MAATRTQSRKTAAAPAENPAPRLAKTTARLRFGVVGSMAERAAEVMKADITVQAPSATGQLSQTGQAAQRRSQGDLYYSMYRAHPTVRAAIEKIAKTAVATGYQFSPATAETPLDLGDPRLDTLRLFFRTSNANQLLRATYKDLLIFGDAFWWINKARGGVPLKAQRLHPKYTTVLTDMTKVTGYVYAASSSGNALNYKPDVVIHFRLDDPDSDLYGLSPLDSLQRTVAADIYAMDYNGNFFENSAQTGVIFNLKNCAPDEVERNRTWLETNYVGARNAHKPLVLEGDVDVKKAVSTPQEMEFIEGRKFNREEILSVLDVPATKVAISGDSNRSTSKEDDNTFRSETIQPLQSVIEEEISNALILGMFGWEDIVFKHREVSKRDLIELTKMLSELERMGVYSPDEVRGELGMAKTAGGDIHFVQTAAGLIPLSMITAMAERLVNGGLLTGLGTNQQGPAPAAPASPDPTPAEPPASTTPPPAAPAKPPKSSGSSSSRGGSSSSLPAGGNLAAPSSIA